MNANTPADVMFSFTGLVTRADAHSDGLRIAFFADRRLRRFVDYCGAWRAALAGGRTGQA